MNVIPRANQEFETTWNKLHRDGINGDMLAQQNLACEKFVPFWEQRDSLTGATALIRRRVQTFATNLFACQSMSLVPPASNATSLNAAIAAELPKVRRHAIGLLYNRADAEDLVQDCLEAALARQSTLQDPGRLRGWLFAILNNLFLMRMRTNSRRGVNIPIDEFTESLVTSSAADDRGMALDLARAMGPTLARTSANSPSSECGGLPLRRNRGHPGDADRNGNVSSRARPSASAGAAGGS
jgi:hypothetical protein